MNRPAPTCATTPTLTRRRLVMALPLLGGVAWSPNAGARGAPQRASRALMGTQVDIVADGGDAPTLNAAIERAFTEMQRLAALMTRYQPDSAVSQINRAAGIHPVAVPPEVMAVLLAARRMSDDSGGAFDPTVGALKERLTGSAPAALFIREAGSRLLAGEATDREIHVLILLTLLIIHRELRAGGEI